MKEEPANIKLKGRIAETDVEIMIDFGASLNFIDKAYTKSAGTKFKKTMT